MASDDEWDLDLHPHAAISVTVDGTRVCLARADVVDLVRRTRSWTRPVASGAAPHARPSPSVAELQTLVSAIVKRNHLRASDEQQLLESLELFATSADAGSIGDFAPQLRTIQALRISGTLRRRIDELLADGA